MKKYKLLSLFVILISSCTSENNKPHDTLSAEKGDAIDSLLNRYETLGHFSGTVLIEHKQEPVYQKHFGFANYEDTIDFTAKSRFKIEKRAFKQAGITNISLDEQNNDKYLVKAYQYHNYRGKGLELEAVQAYENTEAEPFTFAVSAEELANLIGKEQDSIYFSGYIKTDGFSYAVKKSSATQTTIIVLSNRRHPVADEILNSIQAILLEQPYDLPLARKPYPIDTFLMKEYEGTYSLNEQIDFKVEIINDSLFVFLGPNKVALIPQSKNQFYMQEQHAAMRFLRDSTSLVNRVALYNGFLEPDQIAKKQTNQ